MYMNRSFFSKTRYLIGVGFKKLDCTPVAKITLKLPPPLPEIDFDLLYMKMTRHYSHKHTLLDYFLQHI